MKILSFADIDDYFDISAAIDQNVKNIPIQALSDIVRINLLADYGGVWVDATCVCVKPLNIWLPQLMNQGFFAFSKPANDRELSSWFLASEKHGYIVQKWREHTNNVWRSGTNIEIVNGLLSYEEMNSKDLWDSPSQLPYFWFHYSFTYLLNTDTTFRNT